jgi:hypothetical protein
MPRKNFVTRFLLKIGDDLYNIQIIFFIEKNNFISGKPKTN